MNICYIFGSLDVDLINVTPDNQDFIIAADKGIENTRQLGLKPDYVVGDFDSLNYVPEGENVIKHPVMKDDTDLMLAIKIGLDKGYKNFKIYGCLGGARLDHTIASLQSAAFIKENGGDAVLYDGDTTLFLLKDGSICFNKDKKGLLSVFSYSEKTSVTIKGLLYETENVTLTQNFPLGISNKFIGNACEITVHNGTALIILKENEV